MPENFEIAGIALTAEDAALRPSTNVTTTKIELASRSVGKMFLALTDNDPDTPNVMGLIFNGEQVPIRKNERFMGTNSTQPVAEGRYKPYPFDIPMRFLEDITGPTDFTIQFLLGTTVNGDITVTGTSPEFTLTITA